MKTLMKIPALLLLMVLYQSCLPDSLTKWDEAPTEPEEVVIKIPPSNLSYPNSSYALTRDTQINPSITPTVTTDASWPVTSWSISPAISDDGLSFNESTGVISGTPADWFTSTTYTVTASNEAGSTSTTVALDCLLPSPYDDSTDFLVYAGTTQSIRLEKNEAMTELTATCDGDECIEVVFSIYPEIDSFGLEIDEETGAISGTPTDLNISTLSRTVTIGAGGIVASATPATGADFRNELFVGATLIIENTACGIDGETICTVASVAQDSFTLSASHKNGATDGTVLQFGAVYTISATPDTSSGLGDTLETQVHIGVDPSNLGGMTYGATNFTFSRDVEITPMTPVVLGEDLTFSIQDASETAMTVAEFTEETGLDFDTETGTISGTPRPKTRQTLDVASIPAALYGHSSCGIPAAGVYTCKIPFVTDSVTLESGYIIEIDTIGLDITVDAIEAKQTIRVGDLIRDMAGLGFSQAVTSAAVDSTVNGYMSSTAYYFVASNSVLSTKTAINIKVPSIAPSTLQYSATSYNFSNNVDISEIQVSSVNGDTFGRVFSISPDISIVIPGLTFDTSTGEISGRPVVASAPSVSNFMISVDNLSSGVSQSMQIGIYDDLSPLEYDQESTIKVQYVDSDGGAGDGTPTTGALSSPAVGTVSVVDVANKMLTITGLLGIGFAPAISIGDTIQTSDGEDFQVVDVINLVEAGSTFTFSPFGYSASDTSIQYQLVSGTFADWDSSDGVLSGTMTESFGTQSFTISASNAVSNSNSVVFSIAPLITVPTELSYSNQILLKVDDSSVFEVYQSITSSEGGRGIIRSKNDVENILVVDVMEGSFDDTDSVDNLVPFTNELTTVSSNYGIIDAVLAVSDATTFSEGSYISTDSASDEALIVYKDGVNNKLYVRVFLGDFSASLGTLVCAASGGGCGGAITLDGVEANNLKLTLVAAAPVGTYYSAPKHDYDVTTDTAGKGTGLSNYVSGDVVYVRRVSGLPDTNPATAASFSVGDLISDSNPYVATGDTIQTVAIDKTFYLMARESVLIAPKTSGSVPTSYSLSPETLPPGLTFDSSDGTLSGAAENSWPKTAYTITATNQEGSTSLNFDLQVFDYLALTNHTTDAPSYILHRNGQGHKGSDCKILADNLNTTAPPTRFCYLDAGELDLHQQGLTLGTSVGANICNYVRFVPYYFNQKLFARTPDVTFRKYTTDSGSTYSCTECTGNNGADDTSCPGDVGFELENYQWGIFQTTDAPGVETSPACLGGNCDTGGYSVEEYECLLSDSEANSPCVCTLLTSESVECGGNEISCKGGPGIGFEEIADRPDLGKTYNSWTGKSISDWTFTAPALADPYQNTNLYLANYTVSNSCYDTGFADEYSYYYDSWQDYANQVNPMSPFQKSSTTNYGKVNPFYKLECLDHTQTVKGTILVAVREFDRAFDISSDIDKAFPSDMDAGTDDFPDWDSFYVQSSHDWLDTAVTASITSASTTFTGGASLDGTILDTVPAAHASASGLELLLIQSGADGSYASCVDGPCVSIGQTAAAATTATLGAPAYDSAPAGSSVYMIYELEEPYSYVPGAFIDGTAPNLCAPGAGIGNIPIPDLSDGQHHRLPEDSL